MTKDVKVTARYFAIIAGICAMALAACAVGQTPTPAGDTSQHASPEPERVEKLAPIDRVEILVAESWPPQYFVLVESGLPNGCAEFDRYEVTADGETIHVAIINLVTVGMACTEEYRTVEHNISLGDDLEPGTTYTVQVNDVAETFVTQDAAPTPDMDPTPTPEIVEETPSTVPEPPAGFKGYQDLVAGVSVIIPESWIVSDVVPGRRAVFQSYPEDKYVGGEAPDPADTKCGLSIRPPDIDVAGYIQQLESSDPPVTIVSQGEIVLGSGEPGIRLEVDSMGRSLSLVTVINELTVVLTCNGELGPFDEIALTLTTSPIFRVPDNYRPYQDTEAGVAVLIPEAWVVSNVVPGQQAVLQSYPEEKYVGGEALEPGDTKCDLSIRPPDIDVAGHMQQLRSDSTLTIVSEQEIVLLSGRPGIRLEVDSMGRSVSLITEINELTVVLTCHGEPAPFDEIAVTLLPFPVFGPPPGFRQYPDVTAGVSVYMPAGWIASNIVPGERAVLQSYPESKYVGGDALEPGDTKCDLTIHPPDVDVDGHMQQIRSDSTVSIVSEQEIYLQSGMLGTRLEVESMGSSISLVTEVSGRVVVLTCFGELAPFDEIAVTLGE